MGAHASLRFEVLRWSIFAVLAIAYMSVFFHRMAPAVVATDLMTAFHTSGAALGSLAAMYYYVYTAMQVPAGVLADTVGNRAVAALGNLVAGAGSILFGMAESFEAAAFGRLLVGLGLSVIFVGLMKSNTVWFSERRYGLVSGLTLFLGNLGAVLAAGPLALALGYWSWRAVFVALGLLSLLLAAVSLVVVRNRPEEAGFASLREQAGMPAHRAREHHWLRELWAVLRTRAVWPGFFLNFGVAGALFAFVGLWAVPLLRDGFGLGRGEAADYTTVALLALAVGALSVGAFSDRIGRRKPVMVGGVALYTLAIGLLALVPWQPGPGAMLLFATMGFAGASFMLSYACAKEVCPPAVSGMAISVVNTGLFLGAAVMQPLFGWALDQGWGGELRDGLRHYALGEYRQALLWMLAFAVIALIAGFGIKETRCRNLTV